MRRIVLLLSVLCIASAATADIYKCADGQGGTVWRDVPCQGAVVTHQTPTTSREARKDAESAKVAKIAQRILPADYQALIDQAFILLLKDPDSRRIEYAGHPYGSAVCGTVNARNAFGGYTGRQIFLAYFTESGRLEHLKAYPADDLRSLKYFETGEWPLLQHCGLAPE